MKKAALNCIQSESNGALRRLIPVAIWCRNLSESEIIKYIYSECELTHYNPKWKIINLAYSLMVKYIFENETREQTNAKMRDFIFDEKNYDAIFESSNMIKNFITTEIRDDILKWFELIESNSLNKIDRKNIGHVKIAFIFSLDIFLKNKNYEDSIKMMLRFGGDTDTNSAILGGLVCSFEREEKIPKDFIKKLLDCDPSQKTKGPMRDKFLIPKYKIEEIFENLIKNAPS